MQPSLPKTKKELLYLVRMGLFDFRNKKTPKKDRLLVTKFRTVIY